MEGWLVTSMNPFINIPNYPPIEDVLNAIWEIPRNVTIDAEKVAKEQGSVRAANIVALGAASPYLGLSYESLEKSIETTFAKKGKDMVTLNLKALAAGKNYAIRRT
jgi:indolepyruvate ferredoxin oxidoreductase beta subunit